MRRLVSTGSAISPFGPALRTPPRSEAVSGLECQFLTRRRKSGAKIGVKGENRCQSDCRVFCPCGSSYPLSARRSESGTGKTESETPGALSGSRRVPTASCMELGLTTSNPLYTPAQLVASKLLAVWSGRPDTCRLRSRKGAGGIRLGTALSDRVARVGRIDRRTFVACSRLDAILCVCHHRLVNGYVWSWSGSAVSVGMARRTFRNQSRFWSGRHTLSPLDLLIIWVACKHSIGLRRTERYTSLA
jgi:hypothetical protein